MQELKIKQFQSTLLMRGATSPKRTVMMTTFLFQSTLLMRGATRERPKAAALAQFQSTLLMRGATSVTPTMISHTTYFNPRSSCEERLRAIFCARPADISIHAPHARSDHRQRRQQRRLRHFNPRSSCEERHPLAFICMHYDKFQSTLLMRGATVLSDHRWPRRAYFNPRSSCEERPGPTIQFISPSHFNPRSSCEERPTQEQVNLRHRVFQSTLLMRGATS